MQDKVFVAKQNEVHLFVTGSDKGIEREISDYFTFYAENYKFMPAFRSGRWDGRIRLYNARTNQLYVGLIEQIKEFCKQRKYELVTDPRDWETEELSYDNALKFIRTLDLPPEIEDRDYQIESFADAISAKRRLILSPTGSGKSLIIYWLFRYLNKKTLLVAPKTNLVQQMEGDFKSYNYKEDIHTIYSGKEKDTNHLMTITTWQSIFRMPKSWFDQFEVIIIDEAHGVESKSLTSILEKTPNIEYRFGTTGTLKGMKCNKWIIEGLTGPVRKVTTTAELIEGKVLANFNINCLVLGYPQEVLKSKWSYQDEIDFLCGYEPRNNFIINLTTTIPGNNLVLFNYIEKHGDRLEQLYRKATDRPFYYFHGGIDSTERNDIRPIIEKHKDAIILASSGVFSTGVNIKNLNNIFFTSPGGKARIRTLQSIGRVLRKSKIKTSATLYDLADNLASGKLPNHTLRHFFERIKIYKSEMFSYKVYNKNI